VRITRRGFLLSTDTVEKVFKMELRDFFLKQSNPKNEVTAF